jgi:hypothetical protein
VERGGLVKVGWERWWGKGIEGWIWCKYCVHMCINAKMIPAESIPGVGARKNKGEWQRGWIHYGIFDYKSYNATPTSKTIKKNLIKNFKIEKKLRVYSICFLTHIFN